jgi:hypothetical protein
MKSSCSNPGVQRAKGKTDSKKVARRGTPPVRLPGQENNDRNKIVTNTRVTNPVKPLSLQHTKDKNDEQGT